MTDRYDYMEETLKHINRNFIRLKEEDVSENREILEEILDKVIALCKEEDKLFRMLYQNIFYGGSFYDGVRIGQPEEFDINLKLKIPNEFPIVLYSSNIPGYVNLKMRKTVQPEARQYNNKNSSVEFDLFRKHLISSNKHFMSTISVLSWMEGILDRVLPKLAFMSYKITLHKNGPALTLKIRNRNDPSFIIDIDLVPCFVFEDWPANGFEKPDFEPTQKEFFAVPKAPKKSKHCEPKYRYWRLSFQPQERELMKDLQVFKSTFRLIKKLRDKNQQLPIASYYIKNVMLWIIHENPRSFWSNSLSHVFMTVLKRYEEFISSCIVPYYWYKKNNLLERIKPNTLTKFSIDLRIMVNNIEDNIGDDSYVAKSLLNKKQLSRFRRLDRKR